MNVLEIFGIIFIIQIGLISTIVILNIVLSILKFNSDRIKNRYVEELSNKIKVGDFNISNTNEKKDNENLENLEKQIEQIEKTQDLDNNLRENNISKEAFKKALDEAKMEIEKKD